MKANNSSTFSKLIYLDPKLNDGFSLPELIVKEDNNLVSSFSILENNNNSKQFLLNTLNTSNKNKIIEDYQNIDLNTYFYSKCNERYQNLRSKFSMEQCEKFYTDNILTFITRFFLKRTTVCGSLEHDFNNMKYMLRHCLTFYSKNKELNNLQMLKEIL